MPEDPKEVLISGKWIMGHGTGEPDPNPEPSDPSTPTFVVDPNGPDLAVRIGERPLRTTPTKKNPQGLVVVMSDDQNYSERPVFGEYHDPVSDQDMTSKGIIWINANHPLILKRREKSDNDPVFLEMVANYVLMVVAQFQATKQYEAEQEDEKTDPMILFREKFFGLQRELRDDSSISYFETI